MPWSIKVARLPVALGQYHETILLIDDQNRVRGTINGGPLRGDGSLADTSTWWNYADGSPLGASVIDYHADYTGPYQFYYSGLELQPLISGTQEEIEGLWQIGVTAANMINDNSYNSVTNPNGYRYKTHPDNIIDDPWANSNSIANTVIGSMLGDIISQSTIISDYWFPQLTYPG